MGGNDTFPVRTAENTDHQALGLNNRKGLHIFLDIVGALVQ